MVLQIPKLPVAGSKEFSAWLGVFYVTWSIAENEMAQAIEAQLRLPHFETHLLTARMEFSRKAALLRALISRSDHPNKAAIKGALNKIQNKSKRNVFAHSFLATNETEVIFVERTWEGEFKARMHKFTMPEFITHVQNFIAAATALSTALAVTPADYRAFCDAAMSLASNSGKSPTPSKSKA